MRDNPLKRRIAAGERVFGTMVFEFFTPGIAAICQAAGADFVLYDLEHSGVEYSAFKDQMAACRGLDIVPLVRVPTNRYDFVARCLDAGALGIMAPMVENAEEARALVAATRYPPEGRRGAAFGMAHDDYRPGSVVEKMRTANERTLVIGLVETAKGIENVEEIAAVPGVDVVWLGHFDLTNFLGIPGEWTNPRYLGAVDRLMAACRRHGKTAGFLALDEAWGRAYLERGFRMLAYGLDIQLLQGALAEGLERLR
jgi:2-keto-3-deoxy-L-rhamnonate aldolase RhmA